MSKSKFSLRAFAASMLAIVGTSAAVAATQVERLNARLTTGAALVKSAYTHERMKARGTFHCVHIRGGVELDRWSYPNLVTTVGGNDMLDKYLAASGYTATWYMMLIGGTTGYTTGVALGDIASSHGGWTECGGGTAPAYSQSARPTCAWNAASGKSKSLSSALTFTFTSGGKVKGSAIVSVATKDATTGTLFSAGLFTGGDRDVLTSDQLQISYTASV